MLAVSSAGPLADGSLVVVSAWRDIHEGALAQVLSIPGVCHVRVRSLDDSFSVSLNHVPEVKLTNRPVAPVTSFQTADGPLPEIRMFDHQQVACSATVGGRTLDITVIFGIIHFRTHGVVRVTAQAIIRQV